MEGIHDSNYARKHEGFIRDPEPYYQHKGGHTHCGKTEFFVLFLCLNLNYGAKIDDGSCYFSQNTMFVQN